MGWNDHLNPNADDDYLDALLVYDRRCQLLAKARAYLDAADLLETTAHYSQVRWHEHEVVELLREIGIANLTVRLPDE